MPCTSSLGDDLLRIVERHQGFALLRLHPVHEFIALVAFERSLKGALVFGRHFEDRLHALIGRQIQKVFRLEIGIKAILTAAGLLFIAQLGLSRGGCGIGSGRVLLAFLLLLIALKLGLVNRALGRIGRQRLLAISDRLNHLRRRKILHQFVRVHVQGAKRGKAGIERVIVDLVWVQLLIDPFVDAHRGYSFDVAGAGPEGQAVERVQGPLLLVHLDGGRIFFVLLLVFRDRELEGDGKAEREDDYEKNGLSSQETHVVESGREVAFYY